MNKISQNHAKALYVRFHAIYTYKFGKEHHDDDFRLVWYQQWIEGLAGIDVSLIKNALDYCRDNIAWPPTVSEFRSICEKASGIPTAEEAMASAIRGNFNHPVIAIAYDKVGSWAMRNSKEAELLLKFRAAYQEALHQFRSEPSVAYLKMQSLNEHRAKPLPPPKMLTPQETLGWRERLAQYKEMAAADKLKLEEKDHPVWPKNKITLGHREFDEKLRNDRRKYLCELDEITAGTLPTEQWYDRTRYLRESESVGRVHPKVEPRYRSENITPPRSYNSPLRIVK